MNESSMLQDKRLFPFIQKLWRIMNDNTLHSIVRWSAQGTTICIVNPELFCDSVLPCYFKHSNWQSFVRQLNLYGFRKVYHSSIAADYVNKRHHTIWQFKHPHFRQNRAEALFLIQRKILSCSLQSNRTDAYVEDALPKIISQLEKIEKQNAEMKKETQWLRQQQEKQQRMVAMLIKKTFSIIPKLYLKQSTFTDQSNNKDGDSSNVGNNDNNAGATTDRGILSKPRISLPSLATMLEK